MNANGTIPDGLDATERAHVVRGGINELDSDEDGGAKTRYEMDSDVSLEDLGIDPDDVEYRAPKSATAFQGSHADGHDHDHDEDGNCETEGWSSVLSSHRAKGNTGGKGVLADYEEARRIQARRNETKALMQREAVRRTGGVKTKDKSVSISAVEAERRAKKAAAEEAHRPKRDVEDDGEDEDDDDEDDDDDFVKAFRAQRLAQLKSVAGLPAFGRIMEVGKYEFVSEVDDADPRTHVVVHLYEEYLFACRRMNEVLASLASRYPHVKFLKLRATEADQTLSHSVLPAFLVYRGGKLCGSASINTSKSDLADGNFSEEDVEWMLATRYGVQFPGVDFSKREAKRAEKAQAKEEAEAEAEAAERAKMGVARVVA